MQQDDSVRPWRCSVANQEHPKNPQKHIKIESNKPELNIFQKNDALNIVGIEGCTLRIYHRRFSELSSPLRKMHIEYLPRALSDMRKIPILLIITIYYISTT